ncbi:hypothetical protein E2I00_006754 [Balaenoptera physalus]|uniref:Uncharacterized protein n=1 Tax=Balaenoptera physalus TaxID=9770 RepID=A0A643C8I5_BALPH|nr:hypothetical protein E2I00_006754 [Balaenoptera physalus]
MKGRTKEPCQLREKGQNSLYTEGRSVRELTLRPRHCPPEGRGPGGNVLTTDSTGRTPPHAAPSPAAPDLRGCPVGLLIPEREREPGQPIAVSRAVRAWVATDTKGVT